jgi:hypothetical protein
MATANSTLPSNLLQTHGLKSMATCFEHCWMLWHPHQQSKWTHLQVHQWFLCSRQSASTCPRCKTMGPQQYQLWPCQSS